MKGKVLQCGLGIGRDKSILIGILFLYLYLFIRSLGVIRVIFNKFGLFGVFSNLGLFDHQAGFTYIKISMYEFDTLDLI